MVKCQNRVSPIGTNDLASNVPRSSGGNRTDSITAAPWRQGASGCNPTKGNTMFGMKKLFGKQVGNAQAEMKKVVNLDLMQAIVGGGLLVAAADGEIEASEVSKLDELIRSNPNLTHFGSEITETINRFTGQLNANFQVGRLAIKRELADIKNFPADAEEAFVNILAVAQADGQIEPAELVVLKEIGMHFGLRLADYGIEA